jgi:hypothetical protein
MTRDTPSKRLLLSTVSTAVLAAPQLIASDVHRPTVAILLNDTVHVPASVLKRTQADASNVFRQAGVEIRWLECSFREAERQDPPGCTLPLDVPVIIVNILSELDAQRWAPPGSRLGFCLDKEVYLILPAVQAIAARQKVPPWTVLAHVLTHEAGPALFEAPHSLQGIMRAEFGKVDWRRAEKGQLLFMSTDARRLRDRIRQRTLHRVTESCRKRTCLLTCRTRLLTCKVAKPTVQAYGMATSIAVG